ncbi:MFS transporter [Flavobacterium sp. JP2137]|uniref:MFS transporter n=1 Tax=Flavobacterium sp. JP2137 TaxID=3414510 RepID=UPI003D2FDDE9
MDFKKNLILIIASMGVFVEALDIAIINLTIPSIQQQFQVSNDTVQWLQTLYVLLYGGFLIIGGKLSDVAGRKRVFMAGAALFLISSLGAGLSMSFGALAFFRALQGLGAALIMPSALSIVTHTFTETQERSKAIGIFSSFAAIGSGSGLAVGGLISTYWGWHWVFLINVPILIVVLIATYYLIDADLRPQQRVKTDYLSGILSVFCLLLFTHGIHQLGDFQANYPTIIGSLGGALLLFLIIYRRLKSIPNPLIDLKVFNSKTIITANAAFFTLGCFFIGYLFLIALILQRDMHYSAAKSGLLLVPFSILSAVVAKFILPAIMKRVQTLTLGIIGMSMMSLGGILLVLTLALDYPLVLILLSAASVSGIGMTICFTSLSLLCIQDIPSQHYGLASSLSSTSYFMGAGIGLSVLSLFMPKASLNSAVNGLTVAVLCSYALIGLALLLWRQKNSR